MTAHIQLGKKGESLVANYLEKQGFVIHAMNSTVKGGEVDIIAQKKDVLAFVEVKMRTNLYFNLSEVITTSKQRKIIHAARMYLARNAHTDMVYRFDVALVAQQQDDYAITYIPNAFTSQEY